MIGRLRVENWTLKRDKELMWRLWIRVVQAEARTPPPMLAWDEERQ